MKKVLKLSVLAGLIPLPTLAVGAQLVGVTGFFNSMLHLVRDILAPVVFTLAIVYFFWGMAEYIRSVGEEKEKGRQIMTWGVIALFVMSSVWAIVYFVGGEIGLDEGKKGSIDIPTING